MTDIALIPADMIPIEREEVHRTGSVLRRDLTFQDTSLRDCITYGFLDMFNASRFICSLKKKGSFSEGSYQITEPPNSIKQYAIRVNGRNGRDDKLKNLPNLVESTLLDCAEDVLGYGREKLKYGAVFDKSTSRFFLSLGKDDDERCTTFEHLLLVRSMWRKQLLKALQRALLLIMATQLLLNACKKVLENCSVHRLRNGSIVGSANGFSRRHRHTRHGWQGQQPQPAMTSISNWTTKPEIESIKKFFRTIIHGEDVDYAQFESKMDGTDIVTFRENDKAFRLFGTNVHVKIGAYIAGVIGFAVTIAFCITYTFYHSRGMGRNPFLDHLELVDLIFAFTVGIPCHILLFWSIAKEKLLFSPFLVFYLTNFALNVIFTVITVIAASLDLHRQLFGNVKYDLGWTAFQVFFTASQGLAIYVVMRCRKYVAAKIYWRQRNSERSSSMVADGVTIE